MTISFERAAMIRLRFLLSAMVLIVLFKVMSEKTAPDCADCFGRYGFPFAYYNEGGFAGGAGIIWPGLLGDFATVIVGAMLITRIWELLARRMSPNHRHLRG
jgi:hypothetical protein